MRAALDDERNNEILLAHGYEGLDLLVHPFTLCRARRTDDYEVFRGLQGVANLLRKITGVEFGSVAEYRPYLARQVGAPVEVGRQLIVLQLILQPFRPALILALVADKSVVFLWLFHNIEAL